MNNINRILFNIIKVLNKFLFMAVKIIFALIFSFLFLSDGMMMFLLSNRDWQQLLYTLLALIVGISIWYVLFKKINTITAIIFIILFTACFKAEYIFPSVKEEHDLSIYIDSGIAAEGFIISGRPMSKEYCEENSWLWDERRKSCDVRTKYMKY